MLRYRSNELPARQAYSNSRASPTARSRSSWHFQQCRRDQAIACHRRTNAWTHAGLYTPTGQLDRDLTDLTILVEPGKEPGFRSIDEIDPAVLADFNDAESGPITGVAPGDVGPGDPMGRKEEKTTGRARVSRREKKKRHATPRSRGGGTHAKTRRCGGRQLAWHKKRRCPSPEPKQLRPSQIVTVHIQDRAVIAGWEGRTDAPQCAQTTSCRPRRESPRSVSCQPGPGWIRSLQPDAAVVHESNREQ